MRGEDRPLAPFGRRAVPVSSVETHGAYVVIEIRDNEAPSVRPGQFHMLATARDWGGEGDGRPYLSRAISFLNSDGNGAIRFLLHAVGPGTARLARCREGEELLVVGPLGNGFSPPAEGETQVLVGGGIGAAPILAQAEELERNGSPHRVLLGFRDAHHAQIARAHRSAEVATDDGSLGSAGSVVGLLEAALDEAGPAGVCACGPPAMLEAVRRTCSALDVRAQLALEAPMACGYGSCFGCVVETNGGYIRLCIDGPVIEGTDLPRVPATSPGG